MYFAEVCTAPKKQGGSGAEEGVNLNTVAKAVTALKRFQVVVRSFHPAIAL